MEIKKGYRRGSKGGQCSIRQRKKDKSHKVLLTENDWEGGAGGGRHMGGGGDENGSYVWSFC